MTKISIPLISNCKRYPMCHLYETTIPYEEQIALLSHYLHNRGTKYAKVYETCAKNLLTDICNL
ncbi:MAG: hypothetical protein IJA28_03320, partial [Coprobacter sp.]|nr:hypothetical protein [Coprobacter sp.]